MERAQRQPKIVKTNSKQARPYGFQPGVSGNMNGRPKGKRNIALQALDAIGQAGAVAIMHKVVALAKDGDIRACELLLKRCWPEAKGRPINFALPPMNKASDLPTALAALTAQVSSGELSPEEGQAVAGILETHRKALELCQIEERLARLESRLQQSD